MQALRNWISLVQIERKQQHPSLLLRLLHLREMFLDVQSLTLPPRIERLERTGPLTMSQHRVGTEDIPKTK